MRWEALWSLLASDIHNQVDKRVSLEDRYGGCTLIGPTNHHRTKYSNHNHYLPRIIAFLEIHQILCTFCTHSSLFSTCPIPRFMSLPTLFPFFLPFNILFTCLSLFPKMPFSSFSLICQKKLISTQLKKKIFSYNLKRV